MPGPQKLYGPQLSLSLPSEIIDEIATLSAETDGRPQSLLARQALIAGWPLIKDYYARGYRSRDDDLGLGEDALAAITAEVERLAKYGA